MRKILSVLCVAMWMLPLGSVLVADDAPLTPSDSVRAHAPTAFTKNMGQWPENVLFRTSSGGATIWITREGLRGGPECPTPRGRLWEGIYSHLQARITLDCPVSKRTGVVQLTKPPEEAAVLAYQSDHRVLYCFR